MGRRRAGLGSVDHRLPPRRPPVGADALLRARGSLGFSQPGSAYRSSRRRFMTAGATVTTSTELHSSGTSSPYAHARARLEGRR